MIDGPQMQVIKINYGSMSIKYGNLVWPFNNLDLTASRIPSSIYSSINLVLKEAG